MKKVFIFFAVFFSVSMIFAQQVVNLGDYIKPGMSDHTEAFKKAFSVKGVKQVRRG